MARGLTFLCIILAFNNIEATPDSYRTSEMPEYQRSQVSSYSFSNKFLSPLTKAFPKRRSSSTKSFLETSEKSHPPLQSIKSSNSKTQPFFWKPGKWVKLVLWRILEVFVAVGVYYMLFIAVRSYKERIAKNKTPKCDLNMML